VVLAGGAVAGTWELDGDRVKVRLFEEAGPISASALDAEVARIEELISPDAQRTA
jgi:hypothetical protein